jgi:uncharacterized protein (DUF1015 family)
MPKIKPFNGIRPNPEYADEVVLDIENLSLEEAKIIRQENTYSYVNMLVPKLDNLFLRGSKNELAFKKINENFENFLERGILKRDEDPSIYVYQVSHPGITQTGIWTVTSVDDYLNNKIKKHELTRADREMVLINYMQQTGIDANPVLITYQSRPEINSMMERACENIPDLSFVKNGAAHRLWKVANENDLRILVDVFAKVEHSYIADGHHRAAASALLALEHRKLDPDYTGEEEYNFFTTVYMSMDQLKIYGFNRLIKDLNGHSEQEFINRLQNDFEVELSGTPLTPNVSNQFGMYLGGHWYKLTTKTAGDQIIDSVSQLDVSILQDKIFSPLLNIRDQRTDSRIDFEGGIFPVGKLVNKVDDGEFSVLFTLYPTSIDQLVQVADEGKVMPPKSTWFEPKFQVGLLIHQIN